jgi:hypothetical protein
MCSYVHYERKTVYDCIFFMFLFLEGLVKYWMRRIVRQEVGPVMNKQGMSGEKESLYMEWDFLLISRRVLH